jgi:hypothetical protein
LKGPDLGGGIAGLHLELDNTRAAAQWAVTTRDSLAVALVRATMTFAQVAMVPEIRTWFDQILDALDDPPPYVYGSAAWLALHFDPDHVRAGELARVGHRQGGARRPRDRRLLGGAGVYRRAEGRRHRRRARRDPGIPVHGVMIHVPLVMVADATATAGYAAQARRLAAHPGN